MPVSAAKLKVAVLHPLLVDLARRVGGEQVEVVDLMGANGDPHHFEPRAEDLKVAEGALLYLVAGMGLEGYLPKLKAIIAREAALVEVGATLGSRKNGKLDPHWWHSIERFRRATSVVAVAFAKAAPEHAALFEAQAEVYRAELDELERWARRELGKVPRERRHLATAHAAFGYFCDDFGFTAHPVQGLNREQIPDPRELAALVATLKQKQVVAIFPERESNPKILRTLTLDTGIRLGEPLLADGVGQASYQGFYRHNVTAIVKGLAVDGR